MSISCGCDGDYDWYYHQPDFYERFNLWRRKRCISCGELISVNDLCARFNKYIIDDDGWEKYKADIYMCEECADIFFNLSELGFCLTLGTQSMQELLQEYHEYVHFKNESRG